LKGIGGFYYIEGENREIYECRAPGRFRREGVKPLPGDWVRFQPPAGEQGGAIREIYPRNNQLTRPAVANIDLLLIVVSASRPQADLLLVDKLLAYGVYSRIPMCIGINKTDEGEEAPILEEYQKCGAALLAFSARTGAGLEEVAALLRDKCVCLAGQSAVGKSSLLNALCPQLELQTGGLSKKIDRGRHTTRQSELIRLPELKAVVVDTPGFSVLECAELEPEALGGCYPEFVGASCRFDGCLHWREPGCGVKERVERGEIASRRYERYITLLKELIERRKRQYD